jgi:excisionase family DNA binding protein
MRTRKCRTETTSRPLLALRFDIAEAAQILRMSRAQLYKRICEGTIRPQKDGARTYITRDELERYVESCNLAAESVKRGAGEELYREAAAG